MTNGRLIRIRTARSDAAAVIYVVAEPEREKAIAILKHALSRPEDEYEDLGRVTDTVLAALAIQPGQITRA